MVIETEQELLIDHYIDLGHYEKALPLLREALAAEPQEAKWHYKLADVNCNLERYDEVEEHAQLALQLGHHPVPVHFLFGRYYLALERYARARSELFHTLQLDPENAVVMAACAYVQVLLEETKEGKRLMKRALRLGGNNPSVLNYDLLIKLELSNSREQLQAMRARIVSGGDEKNRQVVLAMYEQERNHFRAAREHYRQAILLDPQNIDLQEAFYRMNLLCHPLLWPMRLSFYIGGPHIAFYCSIPILILGFFFKNQPLGDACLLFFLLHLLYVLISSITLQALLAWHRRKLHAS